MRGLLVILFALTATGAASAEDGPGDPEAGLAYAFENCSECHAVEKGEFGSPLIDAPGFEEIANTPGMSELALVSFFQTPHPTMPDLIVPTGDIRNLIAYIRSLKD